MTFFDNPPSHGHDVSSFGAMRRNAISCLRAKQEIARRIESKFLAHHFLKIDVKTIKRESSLARHDE
jgi:hypothetical protein